MSKKRLYWIFQLFGWFAFSLQNLVFFTLQNEEFSIKDLLFYLIWFPLGIGITHLFRLLVIKLKIVSYKTYVQIPVVILGSLVNASLFFYLGQVLLQKLIEGTIPDYTRIDIVLSVLNFTYIFFFWSLIYFSYHYLINYRNAEIESLRWQANVKEAELNRLRSQLNPHFMFNSLNSIRALIQEDPAKAKEAINQLSNILRNTLMMEKNKLIPFEEEMKLVVDYLNLEKIRYEERLTYILHLTPVSESFKVPPLLIQTLVENAVKHGISKITKGGKIEISSYLNGGDGLFIKVTNTGRLDPAKKTETGIGLTNSRERLRHVFGNFAEISIAQTNENEVTTLLKIPLLKE